MAKKNLVIFVYLFTKRRGRGRGVEDLKNKYDPQVEDKIVKYCKNIQFLFIDEKMGK